MVVDLLLYILYDIIRESSRQVKKEQINQRYTLYSKMLASRCFITDRILLFMLHTSYCK